VSAAAWGDVETHMVVATKAQPSALSQRCGAAAAAATSTGEERQRCKLATAFEAGRVLEAARFLLGKDGEEAVAAASLGEMERIRRIDARFWQSMREISAGKCGGGWVTETISKGASCSYRIGDGIFQLISSCEYDDLDPIKALAAFLEVDLCKGYKRNVISARCLAEPTKGVDSIWHVRQQGRVSGAMEDNVLHLSCVDALDEEYASLWVSMYTPAVRDNIAELDGVRIPFPELGATRERDAYTTVRIVPRGRSAACGFRLIIALYGTPSPAAKAVMAWMPTFAFKRLMRTNAQEQMRLFAEHLAGSVELNRRLEHSARAVFYETVRRHLRGEEPELPLETPPLTLSPSSTCDTLTVESFVTSCQPAAKPCSLQLAELPGGEPWDIGWEWESLSTRLPFDWADYAD
jgi:hypothetical protein